MVNELIQKEVFDELKFLESSLRKAEGEKMIIEQSIEKNIATSSSYAKRIADIALEIEEYEKYLDYVIDLYGEGRISRDVLDTIDALRARREGIIATRKSRNEELEIGYRLLDETETAISEIKFFIHNYSLLQTVKEQKGGELDDSTGDASE